MLNIGRHRCHVVSDGRFRLDGGAMFGVVPKVLWERHAPADAQNRVELGLNCLFIECPDGTRVLCDAGLGSRWSDEETDRLGIERPPSLDEELARCGHSPEDIDVVVLSHLHFDHAGGAVRRGVDGALVPSFPEARHVVQRVELEEARNPHVRHRASYRADDFEPLAAAGLLDAIDGEAEVAPGVRVLPVGGHCPGLQVVRVDSGGESLLFLSDLCPTAAHVRDAWTMGFDLDARRVVDEKTALLEAAADGGTVICLDHDATTPLVRLERRERKGREILEAVPLQEVSA